MKKMKLLKSLLILFVAISFSNCEEDGPIQFIVVDEFPTSARVTGLATTTSFTADNTTNISDLLDNAATFVEADVEKVTITLADDYSGTSISGDFVLKVGGANLINQTLTLTKGTGAEVDIPAQASGILTAISTGRFPFVLEATLDNPTGDDDFTLDLLFKVKAKVQ